MISVKGEADSQIPALHSSPAILQRYHRFWKAVLGKYWIASYHFPGVADEDHQQSGLYVSGCKWLGLAKRTGQGPLKVHRKMIGRAAWRIWDEFSEQHSSKWGAPRVTVLLINMSTPSERSTASQMPQIFHFGTQMWTFTFWYMSRHLSQQSCQMRSRAQVCVCWWALMSFISARTSLILKSFKWGTL